MKHVLGVLALLWFAGFAGSAGAATPLVDVAWIKANDGKDGVVIVDARGKRDFLAGHIPGAVNTSYGRNGWRNMNANKTPGMFPEGEKQLAKLLATIGALGIDNDSHVVIVAYGQGAGDMGVATRIYWTFKVLGHDNISVLNGGMAAYTQAKKADKKTPVNALAKGPAKAAAKTFKANIRKEMLIGRKEVAAAMERGASILDARPNLQFIGLQKSGSVKRAGTLPGATSMPGQWITKNGGGMFRKSAALKQLYAIAGAPTDGEQIAFCNTGHWATVTWFASSELLGNKNAKMYDGSLADWALDDGAPMDQKIKVQ